MPALSLWGFRSLYSLWSPSLLPVPCALSPVSISNVPHPVLLNQLATMLSQSLRNPAGRLLLRTAHRSRQIHTGPSSLAISSSRKHALVSGRTPLALVARSQQQRRGYAMPLEATNQGVVCTCTYLGESLSLLIVLYRTRTIRFCKATPPTISMRCIWRGSRTPPLCTSHGKPTSRTWRRAPCRSQVLSSLLQA